ncbi:MAG: hypothetical protein FJ271_20245 [Planctomycetes bacterium]|nr:hypothetical protein [Planctomycetota bacterium]
MLRWIGVSCILGMSLSIWAAAPTPLSAQTQAYTLNRFYYYPYYYFPHNYWPTMGPQWPERPGEPYMKPPAYQAYPAFLEPKWRYELWQPQKYYRGFHFWLDQF